MNNKSMNHNQENNRRYAGWHLGSRMLLCLVLVLTMTLTISFADKSQQELEDEIDANNQQSEQIEREMSEIQAEIDESKARISELSGEITQLQAEIEENEKKLEQQQKELDRNAKNLDQRLRNMYKNGSIGFIDVILSSENVTDLITNVELVARIYNGDKELVDALQAQYDETMALQTALKEQQEEMTAKIDELTISQEVLYDNFEALGADKATIDEQTASLQSDLEALQAEEARKAEEARRAEEARQAEAARAAQQQETASTDDGDSGDGGDSGDYDGGDSSDENDGTGNDSGYGDNSETSSYGGGSDIVDYALNFVGCPYVYGGTSLSGGCDCSGFTQGVYGHFGISIPRVSWSQPSAGTQVSEGNAQAGDLVYWGSHVGIYMGGGQVVHASSPGVGIIVSNVHYRDSRGNPEFYRMY